MQFDSSAVCSPTPLVNSKLCILGKKNQQHDLCHLPEYVTNSVRDMENSVWMPPLQGFK